MAEKRKHPRKKAFQFHHSWGESDNSLWLATTLTLHRNMDKFHFPNRLDAAKRGSISEIIIKSLEGAPGLDEVSKEIIAFDDLPPIDRDYFFEHFLIFDEVGGAGKGRSVVADNSGDITVQLHFSDHMQLHAVELNGELERALERLIALERHIERKIPFAFSERFGYLTADPAKCGSALIVKSYVHIPALILMEETLGFLKEEVSDAVTISGLQGNAEELLGDIAMISNGWTLGVTEEMILSAVRTESIKLIAHEKAVRERLQKERDPKALDKVGRALGTLKHCYSIDTSEALRTLSMVKFGIELGWVSGASEREMNQLLLVCRRAHLYRALEVQSPETLSETKDTNLLEIFHTARAEFLRKTADRLQLVK